MREGHTFNEVYRNSQAINEGPVFMCAFNHFALV